MLIEVLILILVFILWVGFAKKFSKLGEWLLKIVEPFTTNKEDKNEKGTGGEDDGQK